MPGSTYSTNLKVELMATGENSGTWGDITNTNLGTALEQAIVGYGNPDYVSDANLTISITNSNAAQAARALVLNVTSSLSLTATRELVVPTIQKQYIVQNNTTGSQSITVKTSAGTGITVPNGRKAHLYVNGTDVIQMFDFVDINGGAIDGTPIGASSASTGAFTTLNASGATTLDGNVTLGNASGDNVTVTGTITSNLLFTDNTYDIGASGATRPRNLFLAGAATIGGNLSVGGTLTLTGGVNLNGNVTVGDSSSDTLTINSTITSNLIFTDNTYDIGASGATRPRNLFLAGNATIGGNQTLTGSLTVDSTTDSSSTITGSIQTDGGLGVAKAAYIGTNLNVAGNTTLGDASADTLTVNSTITSNLIFTDNTYDIGASGATRPRTGYFSGGMYIGNTAADSTIQMMLTGTTSTYTNGIAQFYDTSSSTGGPSPGLLLKRDGGGSDYYGAALQFDIGGGGGRAKIYTRRGSAYGGTLYFATDDLSANSYQRYYIDYAGTHRWLNVSGTSGTVEMALDSNGLYALNSLGLGGAPTSNNKLAVTASNQVGIVVAGNTSGHTKQDVYITRASAGSTIQSGPNLTISNTATNGSYAFQVMADSTLALWSYLRGSWTQIAYWDGYGMGLSGASSSNGTPPLYITATNSSGVGIAIDGGGINVKPSLIQFQQQNQGYWRIGMPQNANRMAIYGYVGATYPELFTFMEGSGNLGTLGIGTGSSTSGSYAIDINASNTVAIQASRSGGTGIRLNDTVTNTWDIINQSNQLQFVRGGTLGWYFNSGRTFVRTATADDTFLSIQSSYSGNPEIIRLAQGGSDGYILIKSAGGDTTQLAAYSGALTYFEKSKVAVGSTSTNGARLYTLALAGEVAFWTGTGSTANTSVWNISAAGSTGDGVRFANVDIGGQGVDGSYLEWTRGGSYDNALNFWIRNGGNTSAMRFQFQNDGTAYKSSGAGSWAALSDIRIKTNVETVTGGLGRIMQLRPVTFDYKSPSAHNDRVHDKGFIADDYMLVYPNSVRECEFIHDDDKQHLNGGKPKALSFEAEFYADLVDAIQTLKKEFDAYRASHP